MRNDPAILAAAAAVDAARRALADAPKSNAAITRLVDAEAAYTRAARG